MNNIKNITFLTPVSSDTNFKLEKKYSHTLAYEKHTSLNLSSHPGIQKTQQDSVLAMEHRGFLILGVADGMGGLENGDIASYQILSAVKDYISNQPPYLLECLDNNSVEEMMYRILDHLKNKEFPNEAGTTLNFSIIGPKKTFIINIGDSRAYTVKGTEMNLRTFDDSLAFELFEPTTKEERDRLRFYCKNNVITNYIKANFIPYVNVVSINNDDYDILCHMTDGISDILSEETICMCLLGRDPADTLITLTINSGLQYNRDVNVGFNEFIYPHDNATAVVYSKKRKK